MRGHRVRQLGEILNLADRGNDFLRHLLVELHIAFELRNNCAGQGFGFARFAHLIGQAAGGGFVEFLARGVAGNAGALQAFDKHLHGAVRQLEELEHGSECTHLKNGIGCGIIVAGVALGDEQDLLVLAHHIFQRADGFFASDKQRHDHVRENHNVAQRENRKEFQRFGGL